MSRSEPGTAGVRACQAMGTGCLSALGCRSGESMHPGPQCHSHGPDLWLSEYNLFVYIHPLHLSHNSTDIQVSSWRFTALKKRKEKISMRGKKNKFEKVQYVDRDVWG